MNSNINELQPVEQNNVEAFNPETFGERAMEQMSDACDVISMSVTSVSDAIKHVADVRYQIAQLDHQLDQFIAQTNANLERFKTVIPVLDRQLTNISARIDHITDTVLQNTQGGEITEDSVKKHQMLLDLLSSTNDSFNNMLMRILSL